MKIRQVKEKGGESPTGEVGVSGKWRGVRVVL